MKRKVLFTASGYHHLLHFHLPYIREFTKKGIEVHVACGGRIIDIPGVQKSIHLPFEKRICSFSNFKSIKILKRLIVEEQYDLIYTHTSLAAFFTRLSVANLINRPRVVYMCHGYLFDDNSFLLKRKIFLQAERIVAGQTDLLITMNAYDNFLAKKYKLGKRIVNIPGVGIDFAALDSSVQYEDGELRKILGISNEEFVLFCAAEFSKRKSQKSLIIAMQYLPKEVVLVLAGTGILLEQCKKLVFSLGLQKRVFFPGYVTPVADWFLMADAVVSSSRSEGLPFNILEAMHFGLPIVASNVKGNADLIRNEVNGLLYPYNDPVSFAQQVRLLLGSQEVREVLGKIAQKDANRYDIKIVFPLVWEEYLSELR